ncbi:chromate transporter [Ruminococcus albus]|uniref:Chromate transporter n=1 Tax=Ruminococcus albus TaxID=1264 RepID=A0A1I1PW04_RUMAL|nr:chromate transporter [Ruminococcus albus]SFD11768.1 chromate transporter [Ruminococcus albus]
MNKNLDLFLTFMKIGAFTFGGGYAMIPLIQKEVCENKKWLNEKDITDIVAISESTPGPIAINAATFVGYKTSGFLGACLATLGVVLPSFLIISLISLILTRFQSIRAVKYAFMGIRAAVLALILKALWMMFRSVQKKKKTISYVIMGLSLILTAFLRIDAVFVIIGCGLFGLIWSFLNRKEQNNGTD